MFFWKIEFILPPWVTDYLKQKPVYIYSFKYYRTVPHPHLGPTHFFFQNWQSSLFHFFLLPFTIIIRYVPCNNALNFHCFFFLFSWRPQKAIKNKLFKIMVSSDTIITYTQDTHTHTQSPPHTNKQRHAHRMRTPFFPSLAWL